MACLVTGWSGFNVAGIGAVGSHGMPQCDIYNLE